MTLLGQLSQDNKTLTISISGKFDFNLHKEFRKSYQEVKDPSAAYIVDMSGVTYMDSSALGMLLILRERAGGDSANITIKNCNAEIKKILEISNFEKMFKIT